MIVKWRSRGTVRTYDGNEEQEQDELERVLVELETGRLRKQNGAHKIALGRAEAFDSQYLYS